MLVGEVSMSSPGTLRLSDRAMQAILDSARDGVVVLDAAGTIVLVNRMIEQLSGHGREQLIGQPSHVLLPAEIRPGVTCACREVRLHGRNGTTRDVEITVDASSDDDGQRSVVAVRDVAERTRLREQLAAADRRTSIGALAAGVVHEINNPLAAVIANLDLALEQIERHHGDLAMLDEILRDARDASDRVRQLVRDLHVFSRADDGALGPVDVHLALDATLRMARNEIRHRARLVQDLAPVPPVRASEAGLGQVFLDVVVNAVQAIPEGHASRNEIRISTSRDARGDVVIAIADTAPDIAPELQQQLFTPVPQAKPDGHRSGLGLALAHRLVASFGGRIEVDSAVGQGTVVRIVLRPIAHRESDVDGAHRDGDSAPRRARVLVVDDDPLIGRAVSRMLRSEHDVLSVTRANDAFDRVSAGESFDLILCDVMMPEVTGIELYERLCRDAPAHAARMIFMTGGAFTHRARTFLAGNHQHQLEKPFDAKHLRAVVNERLR